MATNLFCQDTNEHFEFTHGYGCSVVIEEHLENLLSLDDFFKKHRLLEQLLFKALTVCSEEQGCHDYIVQECLKNCIEEESFWCLIETWKSHRNNHEQVRGFLHTIAQIYTAMEFVMGVIPLLDMIDFYQKISKMPIEKIVESLSVSYDALQKLIAEYKENKHYTFFDMFGSRGWWMIPIALCAILLPLARWKDKKENKIAKQPEAQNSDSLLEKLIIKS